MTNIPVLLAQAIFWSQAAWKLLSEGNTSHVDPFVQLQTLSYLLFHIHGMNMSSPPPRFGELAPGRGRAHAASVATGICSSPLLQAGR